MSVRRIFLSTSVRITPTRPTFPRQKICLSRCPGHTPGGVSFYFKELNTVAAGDTLFYCGIGRTDFPGGNSDEITDSIRNRLYHLPDATRVIAGHGSDTTIGFEKKHNHYIPAL